MQALKFPKVTSTPSPGTWTARLISASFPIPVSATWQSKPTNLLASRSTWTDRIKPAPTAATTATKNPAVEANNKRGKVKMKYYINECLVVKNTGALLDKGFYIDTETEEITWHEPIPGGIAHSYTLDEVTYYDGGKISLEDGELLGQPHEEYLTSTSLKPVNRAAVKLYLLDTQGNSPCFGIDETHEIEAEDPMELQNVIASMKEDFAHFLVANEGFAWSDLVGYDVAKNGENYEVKADIS